MSPLAVSNSSECQVSEMGKPFQWPDKPANTRNMASVVFDWAEKTPDAPALMLENTVISYSMLAAQIKAAANRWQGVLGDTPTPQAVGLLLHNTVDFVVHYLALLGLGQMVIPLNTRLTGVEISTVLNDAGSLYLITHSEFESLAELADWQQASESAMVFLCDAKPSALYPDFRCFQNLPSVEPSCEAFPVSVTGNTVATLIYTSGTTGKPKGVMLSHHNILSDAWGNVCVIEAVPEDRFITISPLFHVFGQTNVLITALLAGSGIALAKKSTAKRILETIERQKVTFMAAVPTMYQLLLTQLRERQYDLSSLRVCHSGAAPMSVALFHEVEAIFGAPVQEGYGLSEASSIVTSNPMHGERKPGTVGQALPGVSLKVTDPEDPSKPLAPNEIGELCVRGDTVMLGYWQRPDLSEKALMPDGWLRSGDMASMDEEGYVRIWDRRDDLINVGGVKVYPREIEEVLYRHPAVKAVAVVGIASQLYTHEVKAFVVLRPEMVVSANDLRQHCRKTLAPFKIPQEIVFVEDIPKGATGKILRKALRAQS